MHSTLVYHPEPALTAPLVEIRRSLTDLLKGNSAALQCDVTRLSSSDLFITFQANGVDISDKLYVDLPETPGVNSVSRRFTVPQSYWKKHTSFTCKVYQGFSSNFESNSTGNIFGEILYCLLGCIHTTSSVLCQSTFDPRCPAFLTSVNALYYAQAQYTSLTQGWLEEVFFSKRGFAGASAQAQAHVGNLVKM